MRPGSIRQARLAAGLTMAELAREELSKGAIYLYETGRARPSAEVVELIGRRTGHPASFFLAPAAALDRTEELGLALRRLDLRRALLDARWEDVLELADQQLGATSEPAEQRLCHAAAAVAHAAQGRGEMAADALVLAGERAAQADSHPLAEAEARMLEVQALFLLHDASALAAARDLLAQLRDVEGASALLEFRVRWWIGWSLARDGSWAEAAEEFAAVFRARHLEQMLTRQADSARLVHEAVPAGLAIDLLGRSRAASDLLAYLQLAHDAGLHLAAARRRENDTAGASAVLDELVQFCDAVGLNSRRARALVAMAELELDRDADRARSLVEQALSSADACGDAHGAASAILLRARLNAGIQEHALSDREFEEAIARFEELQDPEHVMAARTAYADALEARGAVREALAQMKLAVTLARPQFASR